MEGGSAAAIEILAQNLINILKEEISLIRGLDKDAQELENSLKTIQGYLDDAEKKYITHEAVKTWLKDLEALAFDADNVLNELSYHALHNKVKDIKTMMDKTLSCFSLFDHTDRPRRIAHMIQEINTSFDSINKRATDLHLQSMLVDAPTTVAAFETDSFKDDPIFIGRDEEVPKLVKVMTESLDKKISILAVVGMGGMGKTTLTRKVFHHQKMKTRFGCHSWVYVSQTFDPLNILKKFLASLPSQADEPTGTGSREAISLQLQKSLKAKTDVPTWTREGILKRLLETLKDKTYLLVLDDVWNHDLLKWTDFMDSLSGVTSTKGNGIIITTRSTEVASIVNPLETHHLNGLSIDNCWSIIKEKAFEMRDVISLEFETIGKKIARRCQGLPLAAKVVAGVLRGKSKQEWLSIEQKWVEGDSISGILKLSYDNLPSSSLKKCFSYCSILPKGHRMVKQELIELWMAEGFLQADQGNDMESLGHKFVNVLVCNSLLQVVPRNDDDDEDQEFCAMHDLVHDLATSVLGSSKVRYMRHDDESSHIPKDSAKYLRTLFLAGNISKFKLSDFKCLHALSFGRNQELLSSSIRKLIHLRRLDISRTLIEYLPDSIGELHHLQTLRANTSCLEELPRTLKYLISLRHLYIHKDVKLPPEVGRLTSLQTLTHFRVGKENGCRIEELGSLTNLKGKLRIFNLENVQGKEEARKANIFKNPHLFELKFQWDYRREGEIKDENVLEGLEPHPNLMKLKIVGYAGNRFPLWTLKMAVRDEPRGSWVCLQMLVEITLLDCKECEEIPMLGHLPNLKRLYLVGLKHVKYIKSLFYGIDNDGFFQETMIVFPMLERLELDGLPNLRGWAEVELPEGRAHEVKLFPCLEYLKIHKCNQLMSIPSHCFAFLKELSILRLNGLECLPDSLLHYNKNLSKLSIQDCDKLREFPDGLHTLNSLMEFTIINCPNLKSIGSGGKSQGTLLSLTDLHIEKLSELECLPDWLFHNIQNMSKLTISRCSKLTELPDGLHTFNSLMELTIKYCPNLKSIGGSIGSVGKSQGTMLTDLYIRGLSEVECLPDWLFHNNQNLSELTIAGCIKLTEFPDGLHALHSLEDLIIENCPNLKSVGNPRGQTRGTLRRLRIYDCDGLIDLPHEIFDSWAPSLEIVCLENLSSLKNLPKVTECLTKSGCLEKLRIFGVPKFMVAGSVRRWPFGRLSRLDIDASVEWSRENSIAIKETVDGMLQGCGDSLEILTLKGVESWESLPESIQNLTSIRILELSNFGIEELPKWLGNLSSLEQLYLSNCKQLRRLGGSLGKLDLLEINDCEALHIDSLWLCNNICTKIYVDDVLSSPIECRCWKLACV